MNKRRFILNTCYDPASYKEYIPKCMENLFFKDHNPPSITITNGFDSGGNTDSICIEVSVSDSVDKVAFDVISYLVIAYFMGIIRAITD